MKIQSDKKKAQRRNTWINKQFSANNNNSNKQKKLYILSSATWNSHFHACVGGTKWASNRLRVHSHTRRAASRNKLQWMRTKAATFDFSINRLLRGCQLYHYKRHIGLFFFSLCSCDTFSMCKMQNEKHENEPNTLETYLKWVISPKQRPRVECPVLSNNNWINRNTVPNTPQK